MPKRSRPLPSNAVVSSYSNYSSIETFDQTGAVDYSNLLNDYDNAFTTVSEAAGNILSENLQDRSFRSGLSLAGWKPKKNMRAQASEWWQFDWEYGESPVNGIYPSFGDVLLTWLAKGSF